MNSEHLSTPEHPQLIEFRELLRSTEIGSNEWIALTDLVREWKLYAKTATGRLEDIVQYAVQQQGSYERANIGPNAWAYRTRRDMYNANWGPTSQFWMDTVWQTIPATNNPLDYSAYRTVGEALQHEISAEIERIKNCEMR